MVTYADIAKKMGVSKAAISLALRNQNGVSEQLRERIIETAKCMGYRPNPLVSAHMAHLRGTKKMRYQGKIAFLSSVGDESATQKHSRDSLYLAGAKEAANKLGFEIEVFSLIDPDIPPSRIGEILWTRGIPGVIIGPLATPGSFNFDISRFSAVTLGFSLRNPHLHCVRTNAYDMMLSLLNILEQRGYKRPGFAQTKVEDDWIFHLFAASYQVWKSARKESPSIPPILFIKDADRPGFLKWYDHYRPDVLINTNDTFPNWLKAENIHMPESVGYAALHFSVRNEYSGLRPDLKGIGSAAVDLLISQIYRNETGEPDAPKLLLIPPKWHEGATLRPPAPNEDIDRFLFFPS